MSSENAQSRRDSLALPVIAGLLIGAGIFLVSTAPANHTEPMTAADKPPPIAEVRPAARVTPFRDCREARAAGAAPVYEGDPRYGPWLDGDDDGIGCEPYHRR